MCRKLVFLISVVLVLGLAGGASAATWTNGDGDNDWCSGGNWNPVGVPGPTTPVVINDPGPNDVDVTCDANCLNVQWNIGAAGMTRTFTVEAGASLQVEENFLWSEGDAAASATMHVYGEIICKADWENPPTGWDPEDIWDSSFRGPDDGYGALHVYDGAHIWTGGRFRGADDDTGVIDFYIHGGDVNVAGFMLGDNGSGNLYMTGGTMTCRSDAPQYEDYAFCIRGRGGADIYVQLDGGAQLLIPTGTFMTPEEAACRAFIDIDDAYVECYDWQSQGELWVLDINEGMIRYKNPPAGTRQRLEDWIEAGQITGYDDTVTPLVEEDGADLVITCAFTHETAYDPVPENGGSDACPDVVLTWSTGVYVADHNIYFSTDFNDVNNRLVPAAIHHGPNTWDPPGELVLNTTYYWRVDTCNDACAPYKWGGGVWEFTTNDGNSFAIFPEDEETGVLVDSNLVWGGCNADSYNVYFSMDFNDVNERKPAAELATGYTQTTIDPCAGDLTPARNYYWAVDIVRGVVTSPGEVWSFWSKPDIVDVDMFIWYKLDEGSGDDAFDSSGYENHADMDGPEENWDANDGRFGGSRWFDDDTDIEVPARTTIAFDTLTALSASVWLKNSNRPQNNNWVFAIGEEDSYQFSAAVPMEDGKTCYFQAGNDSNDVLEWDMQRDGINPAALEDWHLYVFVKDEVGDFTKIYFDAEVMDACDAVDQTLSNLWARPMAIGAVPWHSADLRGKVDDFRLYTKALTAGEVEALYRGGDVAKAWKPDPPSGATNVDTDVELSWRSGNFATHHDVYFSKDRTAVRDDDTGNSLGAYKGRQVVDDTNWAPASALKLGETYYWRIDEVNEANTPDDIWEGDVWSFTIANYAVIDDFEDYDDTDRIYHTWEDGQINGTGSYIDLGTEPFNPAHGGYQSMLYTYDNEIQWDYEHYWSVVHLPFEGPTDLTSDGETRVLTLYFYGDPDNDTNDTEELYVALDGSYDEVRYTDDAGQDNNDLKLAEWTEWNITLSDFTVDTTAATRLHIGFGDSNNTTTVGGDGIVFIDDIRLYPPRCVPQFRKPAADLSRNCIVDWADVAIMSVQWLRHDLDLNPVTNPGDANLVGHWELEGDANDSSGNNYHGTAEGDYEWTAGKIGTGAIDLDGGWVVVEDEGNTPKLRPKDQVSATAWIYLEGGGDYRVVIKGENDEETFGLEVNTDDGLAFIFRDANSPDDVMGVTSGSTLPRDEWIHTGGTYDANEQNCYVNGVLEDSNTRGPIEIFSDANDGMAIGGRYGDTSQRFDGKIDDVRVYNRGLTRAEVAWLASQGTGEILLDSAANFYDGESPEAINMRDLAVLLLSWGEEKLWPE